jgi:hypothetical protein
MNKQPEALRLADRLTTPYTEVNREAATELRRLHQSETEGWRYADELEQDRKRLSEVNEDLLKTMRQLARLGNGDQYGNSDGNIIAQSAIHKATGETE